MSCKGRAATQMWLACVWIRTDSYTTLKQLAMPVCTNAGLAMREWSSPKTHTHIQTTTHTQIIWNSLDLWVGKLTAYTKKPVLWEWSILWTTVWSKDCVCRHTDVSVDAAVLRPYSKPLVSLVVIFTCPSVFALLLLFPVQRRCYIAALYLCTV